MIAMRTGGALRLSLTVPRMVDDGAMAYRHHHLPSTNKPTQASDALPATMLQPKQVWYFVSLRWNRPIDIKRFNTLYTGTPSNNQLA